MANHLIVGLGGTGGSVIRALRKRIYEEFGKNEPDGKVNIEYLYVDSSPKDLNDRTSWKTLGASVHLADTQKVSIHGVGANVLDNLYQFPGIESFITPEDRTLFNDLGSLISDGIGGQRRRLGRLLFANNLCGPANLTFVARLKDRVQKLTEKNNDDVVTFHICAGLAGGTGSGSIIDAIAQIRKEYQPQIGIGDKYKVYLYLYIPEMIVVDPDRDAGYYQANGYAALDEINAISVKTYRPTDVTGNFLDEYGNVKRLLDNCDAFEAAFLYSNVNERNHKLEIGTELPAAVADFLFQKTIASEITGAGKMARLQNCENSGTTPEIDANNQAVRSRRFMTFGIKRIEYPENEVKEYVAFNFATQAARQMQYNKWVGGIGFDECTIDEVGAGYNAEVDSKNSQERYLLTDAYLTLSKPIIEDASTKKWKDIGVAWDNWTNFFAESVQREEEKKNWLPAFRRACAKQFDESYRSQGVKDFYKSYTKDIKNYASYIRRNAENILFTEWKNGEKSILEVEKYVTVMMEKCEKRIEKYKDNIAKIDQMVSTDLANSIKAYEVEWNNIGWLRDAITNKSEKVFSSYKAATRDLYTFMTKAEGYRYAVLLMQAVINEFGMLRNSVVQFKTLLNELLGQVVENAESKCQVTNENTADAKIVKKYDPDLVRQNTKKFILDEDTQKENARAIRNKLIGLLGEDNPSFNNLFEHIGDVTTVEDIFVNICMESATAKMEELAISDPTQKMTNVNVLEKIKQEYNTDEKLEDFVRSLFNSAQCYLQFDTQEQSKGSSQTNMMRMVQLCLPEYSDPSNFREKFIEKFASVCSGFQFNASQDVSKNYKDNQIVVVAAASGFPLRYVANVANLKQKYDSKLIGPQAALNKMVLHTESFRKPLPSLFEKAASDKAKDLRTPVMLAFALDLVKEKVNPETGEHYLAIEREDEDGWTVETPIGKDLLGAIRVLSTKDKEAGEVNAAVERIIATQYIHNEKKAELRKKIVRLVEGTILPLFNGNSQNQDYLAFKKAAMEINKTQLQDK